MESSKNKRKVIKRAMSVHLFIPLLQPVSAVTNGSFTFHSVDGFVVKVG
uniref:Uncharacterized protein n=1 Tax=Arundo donax TaxID=35708 RepID=A0A0A9H6Q2_ARUDO